MALRPGRVKPHRWGVCGGPLERGQIPLLPCANTACPQNRDASILAPVRLVIFVCIFLLGGLNVWTSVFSRTFVFYFCSGPTARADR